MAEIKFGTDGWRALIADEFTFDNVELVTKAIVLYIMQKFEAHPPVVIGYDTRFLSDKFAQRSAEIINNCGLDVMITDTYAPTPAVAYAAKYLNSAGALMFTASHNPPEYCGIKYIPEYAGPATKEITDTIVKNIADIQKTENSLLKSNHNGSLNYFDPKPEYFNLVRKLINFEKIRQAGIKVIYDPMYATGIGYLDVLLKEIGCEVSIIHGTRDVLFGGSMPEPSEDHLGELIKLVKDNAPHAIGLGTDGDADRFAVIDESGNFVYPNMVIAILLNHLIDHKSAKGSVVKTVATTHMLDELAKEKNIKIHETPVGFKHIGEIMRNEPVIVGGEESGGLSIFNHIPEKDGIVANLSILEAIAYYKKPLKDIISSIKSSLSRDYLNRRIDLKIPQAQKNQIMESFIHHPPHNIGEFKVDKVNTQDGCKLYLEDDSWILIRPSGTEPLLRVYIESSSSEKIEKLVDGIKAKI